MTKQFNYSQKDFRKWLTLKKSKTQLNIALKKL